MEMQADTYITKVGAQMPYVSCDGRLLSHGKMVRNASICALCGLAMRDGEGGVMRPQGGRGHDHPRKVQQRKAQTARHFLHPGGISYPFYDSLNPINHQVTGVFTTFGSNMSNYNI